MQRIQIPSIICHRSPIPFFIVPLAALAALACARMPAHAQEYQGELPWSLRDHYTVKFSGECRLEYAVENGELRVVAAEEQAFLDKVFARVRLTGGRELLTQTMTGGETHREKIEDGMGRHTQYWVEFPEQDGLVLRHAVSVNASRAFVIIHLRVKNTGNEPVSIEEITPVLVGPDSMKAFSAEGSYTPRRMRMRGAYPMYAPVEGLMGGRFTDPGDEQVLNFGMLPLGQAESRAEFSFNGTSWQGEITSTFTPPVQLEPGEELAADPVWLAFSIADAEQADVLYSWCYSTLPHYSFERSYPNAWISADEDAGLTGLIATAEAWAGAGARHVLVPAGWEGRPGSMRGGAPAYPANMSRAAAQLAAGNWIPGLTIDPLSSPKGDPEWSARSGDGQIWLNLTQEPARKQAIENVREMTSWGFEFFAVGSSAIPDEVLESFNMTRRQADTLAFEVAVEGAGGRPVVPRAAASLDAADQWTEAQNALRRMQEYGVLIGPVGLDAGKVDGAAPELTEAIRAFSGSVELTGRPGGGLVRELAGAFSQPRSSSR